MDLQDAKLLYQLLTAMCCTDNDESGRVHVHLRVFTFQEVFALIQCDVTMYKQKQCVGLNLPAQAFFSQAFNPADRRDSEHK